MYGIHREVLSILIVRYTTNRLFCFRYIQCGDWWLVVFFCIQGTEKQDLVLNRGDHVATADGLREGGLLAVYNLQERRLVVPVVCSARRSLSVHLHSDGNPFWFCCVFRGGTLLVVLLLDN